MWNVKSWIRMPSPSPCIKLFQKKLREATGAKQPQQLYFSLFGNLTTNSFCQLNIIMITSFDPGLILKLKFSFLESLVPDLVVICKMQL